MKSLCIDFEVPLKLSLSKHILISYTEVKLGMSSFQNTFCFVDSKWSSSKDHDPRLFLANCSLTFLYIRWSKGHCLT